MRNYETRHIIVVGCGRVGAQLAIKLSENDYSVCVLDKNPQAFENLKAFDGGFNGDRIRGVGFDIDDLMRAGAEDCFAVAAVTQSDTTNLMVAEVARHIFGVPHVIARLYNPSHERAYTQLGFDYVCGTSLVAQETYAKIVAGHSSHLETFGDYEIVKFSLDLSRTGKRSIRVSDIQGDENNHDIRVVLYERADESVNSIPTKGTSLYQGDVVVVCIRTDLISLLDRYMAESPAVFQLS